MASEVFEGQCQCGHVRYRISGVALTLFACHCTECQRQSGSAFGLALWIKHARLEIITGTLKQWLRKLPSGRSMACSFCPECGTRLLHQVVGQEEIISVKPGTLDRPHGTASGANSASSHSAADLQPATATFARPLTPVGHIWLRSKQAWTHIAPDVLAYEGNPETFEALLQAWAEAGHG